MSRNRSKIQLSDITHNMLSTCSMMTSVAKRDKKWQCRIFWYTGYSCSYFWEAYFTTKLMFYDLIHLVFITYKLVEWLLTSRLFNNWCILVWTFAKQGQYALDSVAKGVIIFTLYFLDWLEYRCRRHHNIYEQIRPKIDLICSAI